MTSELPRNFEYLAAAYGLGGFIVITYLTVIWARLRQIDFKLKNSNR